VRWLTPEEKRPPNLSAYYLSVQPQFEPKTATISVPFSGDGFPPKSLRSGASIVHEGPEDDPRASLTLCRSLTTSVVESPRGGAASFGRGFC